MGKWNHMENPQIETTCSLCIGYDKLCILLVFQQASVFSQRLVIMVYVMWYWY